MIGDDYHMDMDDMDDDDDGDDGGDDDDDDDDDGDGEDGLTHYVFLCGAHDTADTPVKKAKSARHCFSWQQ